MNFQQVRTLVSNLYAAVNAENRPIEQTMRALRAHPLFQRLAQGEDIEPNSRDVVRKLFEDLRESPHFGDRFRHLTPEARKQLLQKWEEIVSHHA